MDKQAESEEKQLVAILRSLKMTQDEVRVILKMSKGTVGQIENWLRTAPFDQVEALFLDYRLKKVIDDKLPSLEGLLPREMMDAARLRPEDILERYRPSYSGGRENSIEALIQELEKVSCLLNGSKVSVARLFWAFTDLLTNVYGQGGLPSDGFPQLLAQRFGEHDPKVLTDVQVKLIKMLTIKGLITSTPRTIRRGSIDYWVATDLGLQVLDRLKNKGWTEPKVG